MRWRFLSTIPSSASVVLTESCARRIKHLTQNAGKPVLLRLEVKPGGCEGFQYEFSLGEERDINIQDDHVFEKDGAKLVIDSVSLPLVSGSKIDYVEEMVRSAFVVGSNPNASSGCGCGHSFST